MSVRAKFKCQSKTEHGNESVSIRLEPVIGGSPENDSFYRWTPGGYVQIDCMNPKASEEFEVGAEYYVDFTKAP